jgi:hypothetical protein
MFHAVCCPAGGLPRASCFLITLKSIVRALTAAPTRSGSCSGPCCIAALLDCDLRNEYCFRAAAACATVLLFKAPLLVCTNLGSGALGWRRTHHSHRGVAYICVPLVELWQLWTARQWRHVLVNLASRSARQALYLVGD